MQALILALTISGVVTSNGVPVAGAHITASTPAMSGSVNGYGTTTDEDGRFTLDKVVPARYTLSAQTASFLTEIELHAADDREIAIELGPHASGSVYGKVTGIPSPRIFAGGRLYERNATIDAEGNYRVDGLHGSFEIIATSNDRSLPAIRRPVEIGAGESKRVDLDLGAPPRLHGRVTLDGRPIAVHIYFHGERTFGLRTWGERTIVASTAAAPDGTFAVTLLKRGSYDIWLQGDALGPRSYRITRTIDGETIDIEVTSEEIHASETATPPPATLHLRASDARSGTPLYAHFDLSDGAGNAIETPAGEFHGAITFALPKGRYWVTVNVVGYEPRTVEVTVPGTFDVDVE